MDYPTQRVNEMRMERNRSFIVAEQLKQDLCRPMTKKTTVTGVLRSDIIIRVNNFIKLHGQSMDKELRDRAGGLQVRLDRFVRAFLGLCERYAVVFNRDEHRVNLVSLIKDLQIIGYNLNKGSPFELPPTLNKIYVAHRLSESIET